MSIKGYFRTVMDNVPETSPVQCSHGLQVSHLLKIEQSSPATEQKLFRK